MAKVERGERWAGFGAKRVVTSERGRCALIVDSHGRGTFVDCASWVETRLEFEVRDGDLIQFGLESWQLAIARDGTLDLRDLSTFELLHRFAFAGRIRHLSLCSSGEAAWVGFVTDDQVSRVARVALSGSPPSPGEIEKAAVILPTGVRKIVAVDSSRSLALSWSSALYVCDSNGGARLLQDSVSDFLLLRHENIVTVREAAEELEVTLTSLDSQKDSWSVRRDVGHYVGMGVSPDEELLVVSGNDENACLDLSSGEILSVCRSLPGVYLGVLWHGVVVHLNDGRLYYQHVLNGREWGLKGGTGPIVAASATMGSRQVWGIDPDGGVVCLDESGWLLPGPPLQAFRIEAVSSAIRADGFDHIERLRPFWPIAASPDGRKTLRRNGKSLELRDSREGLLLDSLVLPTTFPQLRSGAIAPSGEFSAILSEDRDLSVVDWRTRSVVTLPRSKGESDFIGVEYAGAMVIARAESSLVAFDRVGARLWASELQSEISSLDVFGERVFVGTQSGEILEVGLAEGTSTRNLATAGHPVVGIQPRTKDGSEWYWVATERSLYARRGEQLQEVAGVAGVIQQIAILPTGCLALLEDGPLGVVLRILDREGAPRFHLQSPPIRRLQVHTDGHLLGLGDYLWFWPWRGR